MTCKYDNIKWKRMKMVKMYYGIGLYNTYNTCRMTMDNYWMRRPLSPWERYY